MKPFNENDLIAYHLNELSPRRARALKQALRTDPALAAESEAYVAMLHSFKKGTPLDVDEEIIERNWRRLWSKLPQQPLRPSKVSRWLIPALTGVGFAFAATSFFVISRHYYVPPSATSVHRPSAIAQSTPSADVPFAMNQTLGAPNVDQRYVHQGPYRKGISPKAFPSLQLHNGPLSIDASLPRSSVEDKPMLGFIPLAKQTIPFSMDPIPLITTAEPTASPQLSGPNGSSKPSGQRNSVHHDHPIDVTLAMGGTLIGTRNFTIDGAPRSQGATHAVSANASLHQQLRPTIGYRVAVSYTRPEFEYGFGTARARINGRIYEVAGTYVVQGPHRGIVSTTLEGGAGVLAFLPTIPTSDTGRNVRGAGILGVSANFALSRNLALYTGYRMQIYKGPDFQSSEYSDPLHTITLVSNEPMVGITYRFTHR